MLLFGARQNGGAVFSFFLESRIRKSSGVVKLLLALAVPRRPKRRRALRVSKNFHSQPIDQV